MKTPAFEDLKGKTLKSVEVIKNHPELDDCIQREAMKIEPLAPSPVPPGLKDLHNKYENSIQQTFGKHQVESTQAPSPETATIDLTKIVEQEAMDVYNQNSPPRPKPPVKPIEKFYGYADQHEIHIKINEIIDRINEMRKWD